MEESSNRTEVVQDSYKREGCYPHANLIFLDDEDPNHKKLAEVVDSYRGKNGSTIPMLQDVQAIFGYIPEIAIDYISQELGIPSTNIYGVVIE